MKNLKNHSLLDEKRRTDIDRKYKQLVEKYFSESLGTNYDKLQNFSKFVPKQDISLFLAKYEIFKKILHVNGQIIECGIHLGGGLMTWAQFSSIFEPYNHLRNIVGFDTFSGFTKIHQKDLKSKSIHLKKGGLSSNSFNDLKKSIHMYDLNRPIGHISRAQIIKGDALKTIPKYVKDNPHSVIALLHLDFDLYEPTKIAIENFLPLMPKGAIIIFDELNHPDWPGETQAVSETIGIRNLKIERFPQTPHISYAVLD